MPISCEPAPTCTLRATVPPLTESVTAPVASLLVTVTGFANVPVICVLDELRTLNVKMACAKLMGVPAGALLGSPLMPSVSGTDCEPLIGVGVAVGAAVGCAVGDAVALGVVVGGIVADVDGDGRGDAVGPLLTGVGVEPGDELFVGFPEDVGVGPVDALDVGCPPGDPVGAVDGTTPPVYKTKYAVGGNDKIGRFGCNVTAPPLEVAGPATVVQTPLCNCAR